METLDCKGMMCPMPIVELTKKMKKMKSGEVLEMLSDDVGSKEDVPAWAKKTGNELLETKEDGGVFHYKVMKK
jgi:TusA-related sulfurtransferase